MMGMTYVVFLACWVPLTSFFYLVRDIRRAPYPTVLLGMMLIFWLSDCCNTVRQTLHFSILRNIFV